MKHFVIYIPGLGDARAFWQRAALNCWRIFGVRTQFVSMGWYEDGTYEAKLHRVLNAIDDARHRGYTVSLVGTSAGGSMALNAAAKRSGDIHRIVTICGANDSYAEISPTTSQRSPSFETSLRTLKTSLKELDVARIYTVRGWGDRVVASRHTIILGAHNRLVPSIGHLLTISACLTVYSGYVVSLLKKGI